MGKNPAEKAKQKEVEAKEKKAKVAVEETIVKKAQAKSKTTKKKKVVAAKPAERGCKVKGCKREYRAKGYCRAHYKKWRHGEYGRARYKTCKDMGCLKPMGMNRHGYCEEHFQNYYVKGMEVTKIPAAAPAAPAAAPKPAEKVA